MGRRRAHSFRTFISFHFFLFIGRRHMPKRAALWVWFTLIVVLSLLGCSSEKQTNGDEAVATAHEALTVVAQHDFEDGTLKGWIPRGAVTLTNSTEAAADGTHSLKTTGRSANFHGPSLNV